MTRLHCLPDGRVFPIRDGETILQACVREGVPHAQARGGQAKCSTCRVWVLDGLENCAGRKTAEQSLASRLTFASQIRLACQTTVTGDVRFRRLVLDELDLDLTTQLARKRLGPCGESREIAILFADIRDFTRLSQALSAYDVMYVLNRCMYQFGEIVESNGGHIDNIIGDGIMALFGVNGEEDAPLRGIKAALEMLQAVDRMKPYMAAMYDQAFDIKIGVHYGEAVVGRLNGAVFAFNNACPHLNLPAFASVLTADSGIQCRWHESCFDLATGAIRTWCDALTEGGIAVGHEEIGNVSKNRRPMVVYPARTSDGGIWVSFETG